MCYMTTYYMYKWPSCDRTNADITCLPWSLCTWTRSWVCMSRWFPWWHPYRCPSVGPLSASTQWRYHENNMQHGAGVFELVLWCSGHYIRWGYISMSRRFQDAIHIWLCCRHTFHWCRNSLSDHMQRFMLSHDFASHSYYSKNARTKKIDTNKLT